MVVIANQGELQSWDIDSAMDPSATVKAHTGMINCLAGCSQTEVRRLAE